MYLLTGTLTTPGYGVIVRKEGGWRRKYMVQGLVWECLQDPIPEGHVHQPAP